MTIKAWRSECLLLLVLSSLHAYEVDPDCSIKCHGHGRCLERDICMCDEGWYGRNCTNLLADWAAMHKLEHNFYEHESFKSRYVLAAYHLRSCKNILEVGGYRTPISSFLFSTHESVTTVDPYVKPYAADVLNGAPCRVRHLPMLLEDYRRRGDEDCFVFMGLDYYDQNNSPMCSQLKDLVRSFDHVILDYAGRYPTGAQCFQALELPSSFHRDVQVVLEVEGNEWGNLSGSWMPTGLTTRVLSVLRHHRVRSKKTKAFSSASEYSGARAVEQEAQAGGRGEKDGARDASSVMQRAGGEVTRSEDEGVRGWRLTGLVDGVGGGGEGGGGEGGGEEGGASVSKLEDVLPRVSDNYQVALHHARMRNWTTAQVYWKRFTEEVTKLEPRDARGYNNLGLAYENAGEEEEAMRAFEHGLEFAPDHHGLNYNYAKLLLDVPDMQAALRHLLRAAAADPDNCDILFYLGIVYRQIGQHSESAKVFEEVRRKKPNFVFKYINTDTNEFYDLFVKDEKLLLDELAGWREEGGCSPDRSNACQLRSLVQELRKKETTLEFIGDRQLDGRRMQRLTGYLKHSFAYGSTFYQSWLKVFQNQVLQEAVEHAKSAGKIYGVLGSSIGWHVFYGALTWSLRAKGWEILCSQVEIAKEAAARHLTQEMSRLISFECLDALQADLSGIHILVLAFSRDVNLGAILNQKLADELAPGTLVVSWSRILDAQPEFERAAVYKVAVSWSDSWGMYVYRRKAS